MTVWAEWMATPAWGVGYTETRTIDLGGSYNIFASVALSAVEWPGGGDTYNMNIYITSYVSKGDPYAGTWNCLFINDCTSITASLYSLNAAATGVLIVTTNI
jgi:hypothetical protein